MDMPIHPETFTAQGVKEQFLSYPRLNELFLDAQKNQDDSDKVKAFFSNKLRDLVSPFGLGWGNRLEKQLSLFVPVYHAAGGPVHEAVDHLIASKILRNLRNRFDLQREPLEKFKQDFSKVFSETFKDEKPAKGELKADQSLAIVEKELKRLGA